MCEQCLTKAVLVKANVLPGYALMKATVSSDNWPANWYGLVRCNDPVLVFPELARDPLADMSGDEIDALTTELPGTKEFDHAVELFRERQCVSPLEGYKLVLACISSGYTEEEYGTNLEYWLVHHLAGAI